VVDESHRIALGAQLVQLLWAMPGSTGRVRPGYLSWQAAFTPTTRSATYTVRVSYRAGESRPEVMVVSPPLVARGDGQPIPHVFPRNRPCLHLPGEWTSDMWMHQTVIPWVSEWLFFYELWLATGSWMGRGHDGAKPSTAEVVPGAA
jgi:hypothetical protein